MTAQEKINSICEHVATQKLGTVMDTLIMAQEMMEEAGVMDDFEREVYEDRARLNKERDAAPDTGNYQPLIMTNDEDVGVVIAQVRRVSI